MKVPIRYGRGAIEISIPNEAKVAILQKPQMPLLVSPEQEVDECLTSVQEAAKGCKSACILVCDVTRPVPNGLFLRKLIERINKVGVPLERICVLIATGLHRPNEGEELDEVLGDPEISNLVQVVNHHASIEEEHVDLGPSASGTPIALDKRFLEAEFKVATGLVEPHFMAGWSGGRKVVLPGVAAAKTIRSFHSARFLEDPLATGCNLEAIRYIWNRWMYSPWLKSYAKEKSRLSIRL